MITHSLIQGSPDWHAYRAAHFNASDAPAMMGCSPYRSRTDLLQERHTGTAPEVDPVTQARFDDGHRFEALARPRAEELVGEELYPITGSLGKLSASFDGITLGEDVVWEHKTLNDDIRSCHVAEHLGLHYRVQMEQQLLVSGAGGCLFLATCWDANDGLIEERHFWYAPDEKLRAEIIAGWAQFEQDLATYEHIEVLPPPVAAAVQDLPALSIRVDGQLTLNHNLVLFGEKLKAFVADIDTNPSDDQAFADAEQAIKVMERAEHALGAAEASALGQISTVDEMVKTVASYKDLARKTRLMLEKVVKARKETIRVEIQQAGKDKAAAHIAALNARLGKPYMPTVLVDFAGVMKGKKTVTSLRDAVDTELARFKIEANAIADRIQINLGTLRELAGAHAFLFADTASIVLKAPDDLAALVKMRIAEHEAAEQAKADALRARIAEEERVKAEAAAAEKVRQEQAEAARVAAEAEAIERARVAVETKRQLEEQAGSVAAARARGEAAARAAQQASAAPAPAPAVATPTDDPGFQEVQAAQVTPIAAARPAAVSTPPALRLGQINERLAPIAVTADGLARLGFAPAATDKSAKLYHETSFPAMCAALIRHVTNVAQAKAA